MCAQWSHWIYFFSYSGNLSAQRDVPVPQPTHPLTLDVPSGIIEGERGGRMLTPEQLTKHIETFKTFCKNNRLRLKESGDGLPVARAIGKFNGDEFFCNFKDGSIGVYAGRETQRQFTYLHKKLMKLVKLGRSERIFFSCC